ncbi:MAG TPA: glycosyltransferase [Baekduia sp.]|nr:glycosyltransferase [Baekduia sp.]
MRIALVYDCLFPWTVGGAERWMRNVAEALAAEGHRVTFLTRQQWDPATPPRIPGVEVIAVSRDEPLYGPDGNRTIGEPLRFGWGVLRHLLRHGRDYDVVHTASFPYFSLLAAGAARRRGGYRIVADWHEVWSADYWEQYLGGVQGRVARAVQRACARVPQQAFCFSRMHAERLRDEGLRGEVVVLRGEYAGPLDPPPPRPAEPLVVFAGRMIPEKQAPAVVPAVMAARERVPELRAVIFGDGPQLADVRAAIAQHRAQDVIEAPGFVDGDRVEDALARAACLLLPSIREGYGAVVVEAAAAGVPSVLVAAPDNAAVEHIEEGVNGFVAADASPAALAGAIVAAWERRDALRASTAAWFAAHATELAMTTSLERVVAGYRTPARP